MIRYQGKELLKWIQKPFQRAGIEETISMEDNIILLGHNKGSTTKCETIKLFASGQ